jgi:hypothetical protein
MISFECTKEEFITIGKIVKRARKIVPDVDAMSLNMDISACHANGCPLKLDELLAADGFNFSHDVFGIRRHIDRKTGQLMDCFVPRFAQPERATVAD